MFPQKPNPTEVRPPLSTIRNSSRSVPNTPTRYAPSTPHALRALQQQSARKTRSARATRTIRAKDKDVVRPDSARGILRRLAKITAQSKKGIDEGMRALSGVVDVEKENVRPPDEDDDAGEEVLKQPRLTLNIDDEDDSLDLDASELPEGYDDEEDTEELPAVPTPSILPDNEDDMPDGERGEPSVTFKTIDFANARRGSGRPVSEKLGRRKSRLSFAQLRSEVDEPEEEEEDDPTILTERGRRAVSEEVTGRLSRYSFGSIRMSDFGEDLEVRRESKPRFGAKLEEARKNFGAETEVVLEGETELLNRLRSSMLQSPLGEDENEEGPVTADDGANDFQLFVPEEDEAVEAVTQQIAGTNSLLQPEESSADEVEPAEGFVNGHNAVALPQPKRRLTDLETSALASQTTRRKKRQKMTRHGAMVPTLPTSLIKRVATDTCVRNGRRRPQLGRDHMIALEQATEWFFEQVGEDLAAYAEHGKRKKTVDASDVMMLMMRQRVDLGELRSAATEVLPGDVAAELNLGEHDA